MNPRNREPKDEAFILIFAKKRRDGLTGSNGIIFFVGDGKMLKLCGLRKIDAIFETENFVSIGAKFSVQ